MCAKKENHRCCMVKSEESSIAWWKDSRMRNIAVCDFNDHDRKSTIQTIEAALKSMHLSAKIIEYSMASVLLDDIVDDPELINLLFIEPEMASGSDLWSGEKCTGKYACDWIYTMHPDLPIVLVSANKGYAIYGYEVHAINYLLKPVSEQGIIECTTRIIHNDFYKDIEIRTNRVTKYPKVRKISYITSNSHVLTLHMADGSEVEAYGKLDDLEKKIDSPDFIRCHQNCLVNMRYVADIQDDFIMHDGSIAPIRAQKRKSVKDAYYAYFMRQKLSRD